MRFHVVVLSQSAAIAAAGAAIAAPPPTIDGRWGDWSGYPAIATDAQGDASGAFDITQLQAVGMGSELYLRFDTGAVRNLVSGSGSDGTLRIIVGLPGADLEIDFRQRSADRNGGVSWNDIRFVTLPTYASNIFETRIDLAPFGIGQGDTVSVQFSGSDSLASPASVSMGAAADAPAMPSLAAPAGTRLRVASLNTLQTGLFDSRQDAELSRLIDAVDADVYCFQEEYNSDGPAIRDLLEQIDPTDDGASWNVLYNGSDEAVASRYPLIDLPLSGSGSSAAQAAIVDDGAGGVLVISPHHKCCGDIGSSEDATRQAQSEAIADAINDLRAGNLGGQFAAFTEAPVVVVGDWNLVGGRGPLDALLDPAVPGMEHIVPVIAGDNSAASWRDLDGFGFPPGMLDIATVSTDRVDVVNSYMLDSAQLSAGDRSALGISATDSEASDHFLIVLDLADPAGPAEPCSEADLTTTGATLEGQPGFGVPDGAVGLDDLGYYLSFWLAADPLSDVTTGGATLEGQPGFGVPDGFVSLDDLGYYLNVWAAGCP